MNRISRSIAALTLGLAAISIDALAASEAAVKELEAYLEFVEYGGATIVSEQIPEPDWKRFVIVDAGDADHYAKEYIPGAINIEWRQTLARRGELSKGKPILVYCNTGSLSAQAGLALRVRAWRTCASCKTASPSGKPRAASMLIAAPPKVAASSVTAVRQPAARRSAPPWALIVALGSGLLGEVSSVAIAADAAQQVGDPAAIATDWQVMKRGATLGVSRITPAQASAFYRARGFDPDAASHYAAACVFQFVLRNDAGGTLRYRLSDWHIGSGDHRQSFVPLESWEREWMRRGVSEPARIAFRWAQFPAEQQFEPGDWIMGMAALAPRPAGSFDLEYEWSIDGVSHRGTLSGLRCADAD